METTGDSSLLPNNGFSLSSCIAFVSTAFSGFILLWILFASFKKPKSAPKVNSCNCVCSCGEGKRGTGSQSFPNGGDATRQEEEQEVMQVEGTFMMKQLVPEITTHTLSYLDYPSLCRLSITNSLMRRAANDDTAWKALYHKRSEKESF